jgi:ADP-ribose pyrophosphatase YjhB (NUDIX family)
MVVGCLTVFDGKILLCRRAIEPRKGYWNLPAGYLENGESLQGGALRETEEEAGVQASIARLHAVYNIPRINQVYFFFLASVPDAQLGGGPESLEVAWFAPEEIPFEEMAFPSSTFAIRQYLSHLPSGFTGVHVGNWEG